jgi:hypothetical protein
VNAGLIFSARPGALSSRRRTIRPHPDRGMPRFRPVLLDRQVPHVPGIRAVPQQDILLLAGRLKTIPVHANVIT